MLRGQLTTGTSWRRRKRDIQRRRRSQTQPGGDGRVNGRLLFSLLVEAVFCFFFETPDRRFDDCDHFWEIHASVSCPGWLLSACSASPG